VLSALDHPGFLGVRSWLAAAGGTLDDVTAERMTDLVAFSAFVPTSAAGAPIRFAASAETLSALDYEHRIHRDGIVAMRPNCLHDSLNALCWLSFPRTKTALNRLHARTRPRPDGRRGPVRDAATLFDESGAIILCRDAHIAALLAARRWSALFVERRADIAGSMRCLVCGHALLEKLLAPYRGITARVLLVPFDETFPASGTELRVEADRRAAALLAQLRGPDDLPPLPILGIPGWHPDNEDPAFYADSRVFRS
jgi:hypothetical protein